MIVRILTDRPEQFAYLEDLYGNRTEIQYTAAEDLVNAGQLVDEDIVIADPQLMGDNYYAGTLMKRRNALGKPFIISEPGRVKGLTKELKAAGLETERVLNSGKSDNRDAELISTETNLWQTGRPPFRYIVGIMELNKKADAGFLTLLIAEELASESFRDGSLVTVIAPGCNYFYYALSLGKKFGTDGFKTFDELLEDYYSEGSEEKIKFNVSEGISWTVDAGNIQEKESKNSIDWTRVIDRIEGNYLLCFFGDSGSVRETEQIRKMVDALIVVADPLPSSMLSGGKRLEEIRKAEVPLIYVVNNVTETVKKDLILDYLDTSDVIFVPAVDPAAVCESEYLEENPYRMDQIRKKTMTPVCQIIEQIRKICTASM